MAHWFLAVPLLSALIYVASVLLLKRAAELGAGLWHSTVVCNLVCGVMFQGLLVFGGAGQPLRLWWQPLLVAGLWIVGQSLTLYALQHGDVSIATPVLGLKILLVAVFTTLFLAQSLTLSLWLAAGLSTLGIIVLNHRGAHQANAKATLTIVSAAGAAICYALFDVLVQKFSPQWGIGRFLPLTMAFVAALSLPFVRLFPIPLRELPRLAQRQLWGGSALFSFQSLLLLFCIAHFGQATALNVLYSSRGLWSVIAVAILGRYFGTLEGQMGASVLKWRFAGAGLMFAAIALVLLAKSG